VDEVATTCPARRGQHARQQGHQTVDDARRSRPGRSPSPCRSLSDWADDADAGVEREHAPLPKTRSTSFGLDPARPVGDVQPHRVRSARGTRRARHRAPPWRISAITTRMPAAAQTRMPSPIRSRAGDECGSPATSFMSTPPLCARPQAWSPFEPLSVATHRQSR
jgi:hypothetical protein